VRSYKSLSFWTTNSIMFENAQGISPEELILYEWATSFQINTHMSS